MNRKPSREQLSFGLGIEIIDIQPYRTYWLITGEKQKWIAKPIHDKKHSVWWQDMEQELTHRGFQSFPQSKQVGHWLLSIYIEGTTISYRDKKHLPALMRTLAQYHQTGQYLETPPSTEVAYLLFDRLYDRLYDFYNVLKDSRINATSRVNQLITSIGPRFYQHAWETYETLCRTNFVSLVQRSYAEQHLCHRDLANHNWIMDKSGKPWMIDFETACYDLQVGDLWQMTSRILTEHQWDFRLCKSLIQAYETVKPLHKQEKQILASLFLFPNEFLRETIGILEGKSGYRQEQTIPYLEKIAFDYPIWLQRVQQIRTWLVNR